MLDYLRRLFRYDEWANREVFTALTSLSSPSGRSVQLLAHILSAEKLWFERLTLQPQSLPVWPDFGLPVCEVLHRELAGLWINYLRQMDESGLNQRVRYQNSKKESFDSRVEDILTHVAMHGTYHRGQIAADLRASGLTPPYTDFIHAVRQSLVE